MRQRIYNFYVLSPRFDGEGRGFAIGFDDVKAAHVFADYFMLGFGKVVDDYYLESNFPKYYYDHVS